MGIDVLTDAFARVGCGLGRLPYFLALSFLQLELQKRGGINAPSVWARNSYVLGYLKPGISDLDLTLWYDGLPNRKDVDRLNSLLKSRKRIFPFLGEANVYFGSEADVLKRVINPFEMQRDPRLAFALNMPKGGGTSIQAAAFLLRMLEADAKNLLLRPEKRLGKWRRHFRSIEEALGQSFDLLTGKSLREQVIEGIVTLIRCAPEENVRLAIRNYLDLHLASVGLDEMARQLPKHQEWIALWPNRFCFIDKLPHRLSPSLCGLLEEQVRWEIFGAINQFKLVPNARQQILPHLERLSKLVRALTSNESLVYDLDLVSGWVSRYDRFVSY